MSAFQAYANDTQSYSVGSGDGLTIENGVDQLSIYGEVHFKGDAAGKARAAELLGIFHDIESHLGDGDAPKKLAAKAEGDGVSISGDLDLAKGSGSKLALAGAVSALEAFCAAPAASATPKA